MVRVSLTVSWCFGNNRQIDERRYLAATSGSCLAREVSLARDHPESALGEVTEPASVEGVDPWLYGDIASGPLGHDETDRFSGHEGRFLGDGTGSSSSLDCVYSRNISASFMRFFCVDRFGGEVDPFHLSEASMGRRVCVSTEQGASTNLLQRFSELSAIEAPALF
jgi:hypothetical protein